MKNIDWQYIRRPMIILAVSMLIAAVLVTAGYQYEQFQQAVYKQSLSKLQGTYAKYTRIVSDIDLIDQYRTLFSDYKSSGLVGDERRLSWVESLESANEVLLLPKLSYQLQPREAFVRPGFKAKKGVEVNASPMDLTIGMLHEEDLFALFDGLEQSIKSLFTVDACIMTRISRLTESLDTKRANISTICTIQWVTIDAK
ncbi:MAG: hypothetical protein ACI845_002023 [Gammaproteobacteria bacterium]